MGLQERFGLQGRQAQCNGAADAGAAADRNGAADAGADVHLAGRRAEVLKQTCAELQALGGGSRAFPVDATNLDALRDLVGNVTLEVGVPDILVNAQGVMLLKASEDYEPDEYERIMDTNARSVWFASTWFGRGMLSRGSGCVISIGSLASFRGFARNGIYCMSKHSVRALTETLASEWAGRGVRVNAIAPGFFMTDLNKDSMTEDRKQRAMARIPMGRFGELDELAGAAVYLASPAARYVTGETIAVDGGFLAAGM